MALVVMLMMCFGFYRSEGPVSEWNTLSDSELNQYFTTQEMSGLLNMSCDVSKVKPFPWISGSTRYAKLSPAESTTAHLRFSPCCPNGHVYGATAKNVILPTELRRVETINGVQTKPFRIRRLIRCMIQSVGIHKKSITIWITGDSILFQLTWGLVCGFIRIGATVSECDIKQKGMYSHPSCVLKRRPRFNTYLKINYNNITWHIVNYRGLQRYSKSQDLYPDFVLINYGIHAQKNKMRSYLSDIFMDIYDLYPKDIIEKMIWIESMVQHFPGPDGVYHNRDKGRFSSCVPKIPIDIVENLPIYKVAEEFIVSYSRRFNMTPIPLVHTKGIFANTGIFKTTIHSYEKRTRITHIDCTHTVYTPLFYDAVFDAIANTLCGLLK
jgi:hypothetical protein